jgi:3-oxoacyl-[acyl-carrier-protein] synthase I
MKRTPADTIVITGLGMSTSLGNAALACAAARAGVTMARDLDDVVITCSDGSDATITGHAIATAAGFRGLGKLVCLGVSALEDLLEQSDLRSQPLDRTGLYLCLRAPSAPSAPGAAAKPMSSPRGDRLFAQLTALASLPLPRESFTLIEEGNAGVVRAVHQACSKLRSSSWQRCLVGGIDSLVEGAALDSLYAAGRLKTPDKPDGLQPGEAGAFLLLERFDAAERRGATIMAIVAGASTALEPDHAQSDRPCRGVGLSGAITQTLSASMVEGRGDLWLLSDHNGEHARAMELGNVLARASREFPALGAATPWCPASSFGDTGAASAAIAACLAARAFHRGYAPSPRALILSSSDREPRGALLLKRGFV